VGLVAARILESGYYFSSVWRSFCQTDLAAKQEPEQMRWLPAMPLVLYDRIFLLGQSFMPAVCDFAFGFLLYRSRLVPRGLSLIGIIGGASTSCWIFCCAVRSGRATCSFGRAVRTAGRAALSFRWASGSL